MSNAPGPRRRSRGGLHLPRSAWPTMYQFGATPGLNDDQVAQAVQVASDELAKRLAGATRRTEIRTVALDADDCDDVLADLGVDPDAQTELRQWCREHPGGRLIVAGADYQPDTRRTTIL